MLDILVWLVVIFIFVYFLASCGLLVGAVYGGIRLLTESDEDTNDPQGMVYKQTKSKGVKNRNQINNKAQPKPEAKPEQPAIDEELLYQLTSALKNLDYKSQEAKQIAQRTLETNKGVTDIGAAVMLAMKQQQ